MNNDLARIVALAHITPENYPPAVVDALAFQAETTALADRINTTTPVDLTSATTPKDVTKVHAAAVAYEREHEIAARHAAELDRIAAGRVDNAWRGSLSDVAVTMGQRFDTAAETLTTAVTKYPDLDHAIAAAGEHWNPTTADLRDALATLNALREARDLMAHIWVVQTDAEASNTYERDSRTLWFENLATQARFHGRSANQSRDNYYLIAAFTPGIRIQWQTASQQREQPAAVEVAKRTANRDAALAH